MKKLFIAAVALILSWSGLRAQQVINDANAEKREVGSFHGIEVATGVELLLTEGTTEEVAVSAATPEFRDKIVTKVENGILKIHYESKPGAINKRRETKHLKAYVSYKTLDRLHATTGAEVKINGTLQASTMDMKANTGAEISGKVNIRSLKVEQSTGSRINLEGTANEAEIEGDTGSKFTGEAFVIADCDVKVSTGAQVTITSDGKLQAKANTGGIVRYKGKAVVSEIKASTGGQIRKVNDSK